MTDLKEINEEINKLVKIRKDYFKQKLEELKETILKLEWLKDVKLLFRENAVGNGFKYSLIGTMPYVFHDIVSESYLVRGTNHEGIFLKFHFSLEEFQFELVTTNCKLLVDLINELKLTNINFTYIFKDKISLYQKLEGLKND